MTHNEKRSSSMREGQIALFTGAVYGAMHTLSGHPLDTIKTKMQLETRYSGMSAVKVARSMVQEFGMRGFLQGVTPPLIGSSLYRGSFLSAYEFGYTYIHLNTEDDHFLKREYLGLIRPMVPVACMFGAVVRGTIEAPFEYCKLMGQTQRKIEPLKAFQGLHWQILRTTVLLLPILMTLDAVRRKTDYLKNLTGNFLITFGVCGLSYACTWPVETLKNLAQSGLPHPGASITERVAFMNGPMGLMRGMYPGALGGGLRNAVGMVAMVKAQEIVTRSGFRDM